MKPHRNTTARRPASVSRDVGIVAGVSVVLSILALVVFAATVPA